MIQENKANGETKAKPKPEEPESMTDKCETCGFHIPGTVLREIFGAEIERAFKYIVALGVAFDNYVEKRASKRKFVVKMDSEEEADKIDSLLMKLRKLRLRHMLKSGGVDFTLTAVPPEMLGVVLESLEAKRKGHPADCGCPLCLIMKVVHKNKTEGCPCPICEELRRKEGKADGE